MTLYDDGTDHLTPVFSGLLQARTRGELGEVIYAQVSKFSHLDLHILGSALRSELCVLPSPYREMVEPYLDEELFGRYYRILAMHSAGSFLEMAEDIRDRKLFEAFCQEAMSFGSEAHEAGEEALQYAQLGGLSYFLLHCFALFVLDEPGHPVGMLFPDGSRVVAGDGLFYCPARHREEGQELSLCKFCPAVQAGFLRGSSRALNYST